MDFESYVRENKKLIMDAGSVARLPSVEKFVGFSSGAAVHLAGQKDFSLENNPYGALKKEYEETLDTASKEARADISIARVWSVSGSQVTKPDLFALSNLIMQAKTGHIEVRAPQKVFRRYAAIEDVIAVALSDSGLNGAQIFDTGGELIEIGELANLVKALVNPEAKIQRTQQIEGIVDDYHSDGESWKRLVEEIGIEAADLETQILRVAQNF
jgi:nucleoside-diphosphate-sugar epimerase